MDLRFTPEENAFRAEVRAFMKENLPPAIRAKMIEGDRLGKEDMIAWQRILNAKGWAVPHWPKEWGGTGWGPVRDLSVPRRDAAGPGAGAACRSASTCSVPCSSPSATKRRKSVSCRASPISTTGGARVSPSPAPAPISPR